MFTIVIHFLLLHYQIGRTHDPGILYATKQVEWELMTQYNPKLAFINFMCYPISYVFYSILQ